MAFSHLVTLVICTLMVVNGGVVKRSDDLDLQTLQTLVQQQAAAISTLQATVNSQQAAINGQQAAFNSLQTEFTGMKTNVQILSKPVAFTARLSHDDGGPNGIVLGPHQTLVFDTVITNAGSSYDATTGIFRAPLAGYYAFSIVAMEPDGASHPALSLSIVKNGVVVDMMWAFNAQNVNNEQGSTHAVLHLAAGDQVWIRQEMGDGVRGSWYTVFTGYLVHAE